MKRRGFLSGAAAVASTAVVPTAPVRGVAYVYAQLSYAAPLSMSPQMLCFLAFLREFGEALRQSTVMQDALAAALAAKEKADNHG